MSLYEVSFDATTYIVVANNGDELFDLLRKSDPKFEQTADMSIVYNWDEDHPEECHIHLVDQNLPHVVFTVSH